MSKFKLNDQAGKEDYVFVNGNTKYLAACSQEDLEVLHKNGDPRVSREPGQDDAAAAAEKAAPKKDK